MRLTVVVFTLLCGFGSYVRANDKVILCYYGTWATYRPGLGKFDVEDINPNLCTHIVYSFVGINNDGSIRFLDPFLDLSDNWGRNNIVKLNELKTKNPQLKTILAVGGYSEGSAKYSAMAASPQLRSNFVRSATETVLRFGFDGFDVDWEYPNGGDSVHGWADIDNFTQVLKELKESLEKYGLLLTAAVAATPYQASRSYDVAAISKYLDYIGLMAYDMNGAWASRTGHNAPLYRGIGDENVAENMLFTVDVSVRYWLDNGCPPEKLLVGMPLYGRTFNLVNAAVSSVRAPANGPGVAGPYTRQAGILGYNEICENFQTSKWDYRYDPLAEVPYAVQGSNWLSYDDPASLENKINYGHKYGLGGVIVWSIETDDFRGICQDEDYPLLRSINNALKRGSGSTTTTTTTTSTTTTKPTSAEPDSIEEEKETTKASTTSTQAPSSTSKAPSSTTSAPIVSSTSASTEAPASSTSNPSEFTCKKEGQAPNPVDCASFYICTVDTNKSLHPTLIHCPGGLYYDAKYEVCNYKYLVDCDV